LNEGILIKMADYPGLFRLPLFSDSQAGKKAERNHGVEQRKISVRFHFLAAPPSVVPMGIWLQTAVIRLRKNPPYHSRFFEKSMVEISLYQKMAL